MFVNGKDSKVNSAPSLSWPEPLAEEAFHGLAGDFVHTIGPHTESDPAALLLQLLVAFGNVIGKGLHWSVEATRHALNLFLVLVGETSKARKGTSWNHVKSLFSRCDPAWGATRIQTGLSSGEGLIQAVCDPKPKVEVDLQNAGTVTPKPCLEEPPDSHDQRLLVMESEFASPLRMTSRDGNTLLSVIREAWDGDVLQTMTKQCPQIATRAHISIIGHITRDELRRELTRTDAGSGFGNRFLWACVQRSKALPDGGCLPPEEFQRLAHQLKSAVDFAGGLGDKEVSRNAEARELWHLVYAKLSDGKPGLFGAITSRAEAQVMRIACLYALLDQSTDVKRAHLWAALAIWKYCEASARYIFGDALGDSLADYLLGMLRANSQGMTRTELSIALGRNRRAEEIDRALNLLEEQGLAGSKAETTPGRPAERWFATSFGGQDVTSSNSFNSSGA